MTLDLEALKAEVENWRDGPGPEADTRVRFGDLSALIEAVEAAQALIEDREIVGRNGDSVISGSAVIRLETALAPFVA